MFRFLITLSITSLVAGIVFFPLVHYRARDTKDPDAYEFVAFFVSILLIVFAAVAGFVSLVWWLRSKQNRDLQSIIND